MRRRLEASEEMQPAASQEGERGRFTPHQAVHPFPPRGLRSSTCTTLLPTLQCQVPVATPGLK